MKNKLFQYFLFWALGVLLVAACVVGYVRTRNVGFSSDRLFILFTDETGSRNALLFKLSRYEVLPYVYDYRCSYHLVGEKTGIRSENFDYYSLSATPKKKDFLKKIQNNNNENSMIEGYSMRLEINGKMFDINLKNMHGDFLVNNSLERLTYMNMGISTLTIDGEKKKSYYALNKTATMDYNVIAKDQSVAARGGVFFLADQQGGLYYADTTEAYERGGRYDSHKWALYRNGDIFMKDVSEDISMVDNYVQGWKLEFPSFHNARFTMERLVNFSTEDLHYGLVSGDVVDDMGERTAIGINFSFDDAI